MYEILTAPFLGNKLPDFCFNILPSFFLFFCIKCILAFHIAAQEVLNRSDVTCGADTITAAKVGQSKLIEQVPTVRSGDIGRMYVLFQSLRV